MPLAAANPHLPPILFCLAVAAYMFAAIRFPALRFMFRMKRFAAGAIGMDDDANRKMSETLGLIFCPLIGIAALGAAGWLMLEWKQSNARQAQLAADRQARHESFCTAAGALLGTVHIGEIYFDSHPRMGVSDQGRKEVEDFIAELAAGFSPQWVPFPLEPGSRERNELTVRFTSPGEINRQPFVSISPESGHVTIWTGANLSSRITLPPGLAKILGDLQQLEKIDLQAVEREKIRLENEERRRLANYQTQTFKGTPAWQFHDLVMAEPEDRRDDRKNEFIGMEFDWECRLMSVEEIEGKLFVDATQSRPGPGIVWSFTFEAERSMLPDIEGNPGRKFARITGTVESMEPFRVDIETLAPFEP